MTLNLDFKITALDELCAQLTRDLFAIAKFLFSLSSNSWVLCDMTTIEMFSFSIKVMMKYDDGFQWVGLKL